MLKLCAYLAKKSVFFIFQLFFEHSDSEKKTEIFAKYFNLCFRIQNGDS